MTKMADVERYAQLFAKKSGLIKPGLDRMRRAYELLGRPSENIPCVLIAGTNGKGSCSGFLWQMLARSVDGPVALYSSPHLVHFRERFHVSGNTVDDAMIESAWRDVAGRLPADVYEELSFFELATLIGFQVFANLKCQFMVLEVGMGGRWDATNIVRPLASAVVSLGLDHQQYLGDSLTKIAAEKLGVIRRGRPLYIGDPELSINHPDVWNLIEKTAAENGSPLIIAAKSQQLPRTIEAKAPFLQQNFAVARQIAKDLFYRGFLGSRAHLRDDFVEDPAWMPPTLVGRFQELPGTHGFHGNIILDGCHNKEGVGQFLIALKQRYEKLLPLPAIVTIAADKHLNEMLDLLRGNLEPLVLFKIDNERTLSFDVLAARHRDLTVFSSFAAAWQFANSEWQVSAEKPRVVCGSLYGLGEVIEFFAADENSLPMGLR